MKISSKFKDYYDSVSYMGEYTDDDIRYVRYTSEKIYDEKVNDLWWASSLDRYYDRSSIHMGCLNAIIIFCGKLYLRVHQIDPVLFEKFEGCYYHGYDKKPKFEWNPMMYQKVPLGSKPRHPHFLNERLNQDWSHINKKYESPVVRVRYGYHPSMESKDDRYASGVIIEVNPCLNEVGFGKAIDAYTAYQTIERFIDMNLTRRMEIVELSDEDNLYKKGFNKFSFRKEKSKKK